MDAVISEVKSQGWEVVIDNETYNRNVGVYSRKEKKITLRPTYYKTIFEQEEFFGLLMFEVAHEAIWGNTYHEGVRRGGDFTGVLSSYPIEGKDRLVDMHWTDAKLLDSIGTDTTVSMAESSSEKARRIFSSANTVSKSHKVWEDTMLTDYLKTKEN